MLGIKKGAKKEDKNVDNNSKSKEKHSNKSDGVDKNGKKLSKRKLKKHRSEIISTGKEFAPTSGYTSTASIMKTGNQYGTILKVVNLYGLNRNQKLGWAVNLIPHITVEGVKGYLFAETKPFAQREQANYFRNIIPETEKTFSQNDIGNMSSSGDESRRKMKLQDIEIASMLHGDNIMAMDMRLYVLIVGKNPDDIFEQLRRLDKHYQQRINGVKLMAVAGSQEKMFQDVLQAKETQDSSEYTIMSELYGGFDHVLRRGLNDREGLPIGQLSEDDSHTRGQAFMELNNSFKSKIVVASHKESAIRGYDDRLSSASLWGQIIANNAMMYGHRVFHLVLNGHRYYGDIERSTFACPPSLNKHLQYVDLSKGGLNPIQTFGDVNSTDEQITNIYNNAKEKLFQITYLMSGRTLKKEKNDLMSNIDYFYTDRKIWVPGHPKRSKIVGVTHPETINTYGDFIRTLNTNKKKAKLDETSTEAERDSSKNLYQTVENALTTYDSLFNTITTLPNHKDESKLQWYYDVSNIQNPDIREAQFINAFDYCTFTAAPNDIVMIHGLDKVSVETLQLLKDNLDRLSDRGVRLAYLYDNIGSGEAKEAVPKANIFNTDGVLYQDFEQQFDYTIIGTMSKREIEEYERKVRQHINPELKAALIRDSKYQFQIRRTVDLTSNILNPVEFII